MRALPALMILFVGTACARSPEARRIALMERIVAAIAMPAKASPLRDYARYYAVRKDGKIAVFYTAYVESEEHASDPAAAPKAGERRWVAIENMPEASDGGCSIINVVFNPSTSQIEQVACNGPV